MATIEVLQKAAKGFVFISETEAPFVIRPCREWDLDSFLGDEGNTEFMDLVKAELDDIYIYRIGNISATYLLIGKDRKTGELISISAEAVET